MSFIKNHWFGLVISIIIFAHVVLFAIVLIAPKQDMQKRGFISCTDKFIEKAKICDGSMCMIKSVVKNNFCNFKVVGDGLVQWIQGKQSTPWNNYIFEPEVDELDIGKEEFLDENPNLIYDFDKLQELSAELEKMVEENYKTEAEEMLHYNELGVEEEIKVEE